MGKPTYSELEAALYAARGEIDDAVKFIQEVNKKLVRSVRDTSSRLDKLLIQLDEARWQEAARIRKRNRRAMESESENGVEENGAVEKGNGVLGGVIVTGDSSPEHRSGSVVSGERIVRKHLAVSGHKKRKPHDSFPPFQARLADLMYSEIEREDGSLPAEQIAERLSRQGLTYAPEAIQGLAESHEWFEIQDEDIAIAKCGGMYGD